MGADGFRSGDHAGAGYADLFHPVNHGAGNIHRPFALRQALSQDAADLPVHGIRNAL